MSVCVCLHTCVHCYHYTNHYVSYMQAQIHTCAEIRLEEQKVLEKSAIVQSISTGVAIMVPVIASSLTFIAMVSADNDLTAAQAFTFVALLNSMRFVLGVLPYGVKSLAEVSVTLKRYQVCTLYDGHYLLCLW